MRGTFDLFVIGAGIAGITVAEEAARRGLSVCIAEEVMFGGLMVNVNRLSPAIEGLPASGSDLAAEAMTRVYDLGVTPLFEAVIGFDQQPDGLLAVATCSGTHITRSVVVATGAQLRKLGIPGEAKYEGRGVAHCADCDAPMLRGETAIVVGGGDSALQECLVLAEFCSLVQLVHRGSSFSGRADLVNAVQQQPRITVYLRTIVDSLEGSEFLTGARLRNLGSGQVSLQPCKAFFAYVGLTPNTLIVPPSVKVIEGGIHVNVSCESSLNNVFAVGAVRSGYGGKIIDAKEDARLAVTAVCARLGYA